jgi:hypothetical protein
MGTNISPAGKKDMDTVNIFIRVPRKELVFLSGLIESFDDLAIIKTLDPAAGIAVVMTPPESAGTISRLLDSVTGETGLERLTGEEHLSTLFEEKIYGLG